MCCQRKHGRRRLIRRSQKMLCVAYAYDGRWPDNYKHNGDNNNAYTVAFPLLSRRTVEINRTCVGVGVCALLLVLVTGFTLRKLCACACAGPPWRAPIYVLVVAFTCLRAQHCRRCLRLPRCFSNCRRQQRQTTSLRENLLPKWTSTN